MTEKQRQKITRLVYKIRRKNDKLKRFRKILLSIFVLNDKERERLVNLVIKEIEEEFKIK